MKKVNLKNISKILFILAYTFLSIHFFMDKVIFLEPYIMVFKYLGILLLFVTFLYSFVVSSVKIKIITLLINALGFISYIVSKDIHFFIFCLCITSMKDIKFESIMRYDLCLKVIILMLLMCFYYLNMTRDVSLIRNGLERVSFGFSHPNTFAIVFAVVVLEIFYVFRKKRDKFHFLILGATIFFLNYFSGSRGSVILLFTFLLFTLLSYIKFLRWVLNTKVFRFLTENALTIFAIISIALIIQYRASNEFVLKLDKMVSGRIRLTSSYFDNYFINLFGNNIPVIGTDEAQKAGAKLLVIDNTYIYFLLRFGIVSYLVFASSFFFEIWYSFKKRDKTYIIIIISLIIYGLVETYTYKIPFNTFILLAGDVIYEDRKKKIKSKVVLKGNNLRGDTNEIKFKKNHKYY